MSLQAVHRLALDSFKRQLLYLSRICSLDYIFSTKEKLLQLFLMLKLCHVVVLSFLLFDVEQVSERMSDMIEINAHLVSVLVLCLRLASHLRSFIIRCSADVVLVCVDYFSCHIHFRHSRVTSLCLSL